MTPLSRLRPCLHGGMVPPLGGLKHSPPLHASHLSEIVSRAAANHNKQDGGQKKLFGGRCIFFITLSTKGCFSVSRVLFCTLLIEGSQQRQLTLKAALEYNAVLSPRRTSGRTVYMAKDSPPRRVPRESRQGAPARRVTLCSM